MREKCFMLRADLKGMRPPSSPPPPKKEEKKRKQPVWSQSVTIKACGTFISESPDKTQGGIILYSWLCKSMSKIDHVSLWVKTGGRSKSSQLCGHRWAGEQVHWHPSSASQQPDLPLPHWCGENLIPARTGPPRCSGVRSHQGAVKTGGWTMVFVREHLSFSLICVTWHVCRPGLKRRTANGALRKGQARSCLCHSKHFQQKDGVTRTSRQLCASVEPIL